MKSQNSQENPGLLDNIAKVAHEIGHAVGISHHGNSGVLAVLWSWKQDKDGNWKLYGTPMDISGSKVSGNSMMIRALRETDGTELQHGDPMPSGKSVDGGTVLRLFFTPGKGSRGGEGSGMASCIMRYRNDVAFCSSVSPQVRYIINPAEWTNPNSLCEDPKGTGVNDPKHSPESHHGAAEKGNCKSQIVVNDKYAQSR